MTANFYIFFKLLIMDYKAESKEIQLCTTVDCQSEQLFPLSVSFVILQKIVAQAKLKCLESE